MRVTGQFANRLFRTAAALLLPAMTAFAQPNTTLVPYLGTGYAYKQVSWGALAGFEAPGFNDSAWARGNAGFGTIAAGCPLNDTAHVKTIWGVNSDILLRKRFVLPAGAVNLNVSVAIDNDVQVFLNGQDISDGLRKHENCAQRGSFVFDAPDGLLIAGENLLAARGRDRGVKTYLDLEVTADLPMVLPLTSLLDSGPGSLREAIATANQNPAPDTIVFTLPGSGVRTITPASPLPAITGRLVIDGTTQPGFAGTPVIQLNGSGLAAARPFGTPGLTITGGGSTVKGLIINGFPGDGILLLGSGGNTIAGNFIGTDAAGIPTAPGNTGAGIRVDSSSSGNIIGGTTAADRNVIAGNGQSGVVIASGNRNAVLGNALFANGQLGIDLNGDGVTLNRDPGTGPNNFQGYPVLSFAAYDLQGIAGALHGVGSTQYRIEFFRNTVADPSGYGEGQEFIGSAAMTTDTAGAGTFYVELPGKLAAGEYIAATATDAQNNTSEFSAATLVTARIQLFGSHFVTNTTLAGIPLHWPDGSGAFSISTTVPAEFRTPIVDGYGSWDALPQVAYTYLGTTASAVWGGDPDGINNNVWVADGWTDLTGSDSNVVAVTRVRYNTLNGQITDADIAYDAQHFGWNAAGPESVVMDVQNTTAHEAGHFSGLGDIYNPGDPGYVPAMGNANEQVTMYGLISPGEISKRTLEDPDSAAIAYIYNTVPSSRVDLMVVFDGSTSFATTQGALLPSKNSALELIQKLRTGDRFGVVKMPSTVIFPLTEIVDSTTRAQATAALNTLVAGGTSAIGSGLQTAQSQLGIAPLPNRQKAMILFSAGEENALPGALTVLPSLVAAGTSVFTFGFPTSPGQGLANTIADSTGGAYYQATDSTINQIVNQIWNTLTGQQFTFLTVAPSDTFQNVPYPGISWQGPVDRGTTSSQPGISWQGPKTFNLAAGRQPLAITGSYVLSLLPPGGTTLIDSAYAANNPGLGIRFFSGPTYQFFTIERPAPGNWTLYTFARQLPQEPEPVVISITSLTDITMAVATDRIQYDPGQTIDMRVELSAGGEATPDRHVTGGSPIIDATVIARIHRPGTDSTADVAFAHLGAGIYTGSFSGTAVPGTYGVTFIARRDTTERVATEAVFVTPPFSPGGNIVTNPGFESGKTPWVFYTNGTGSYSIVSPGASGSAAAKLAIAVAGSNMQFYQAGLELDPNTQYRLTFKAYSSTGRDLAVSIGRHTAPYTSYGLSNRVFNLTTSWQSFSVVFATMNFPPPVPSNARLRFRLNDLARSGDLYFIDDVVLERVIGGPPSATTVRVETAPDGSGALVPAQILETGNTLTVYAIARDASGVFLGNISATWGLVNTTGGVVPADLAASVDGRSATFTANIAGTAQINATSGGLTPAPSGVVTVVTPPSPTNLLVNGGFETGIIPWRFVTNGVGTFKTVTPGNVGTHAAQIAITTQGTSVQLFQPDIRLVAGQLYRLTFKALCNTGHNVQVSLFKNSSPFTPYGLAGTTFDLTNTWASYSVQFNAGGFAGTVNDGRLRFWFSPFDAFGDLYLFDEVVLEAIPAPVGAEPLAMENALPETFSLGPNYPNPFNPATTITYALPVDANVQLHVYTVLGQLVARLIDGAVPAGYHTAAFDGSGLASGLYLYRLTAAGEAGVLFSRTGKMMLTK